MSRPAPRRWVAVAASALFALTVPSATGQERKPTTKGAADSRAPAGKASSEQRKRLQGEQRELQARLSRLRQQLAAAEATRNEAADAVAGADRAISVANRRLRELRGERATLERQIAGLQERSRAAATHQGEQEQQLAAVARVQYALARQPTWQRVIAGESPADRVRELGYLDYVAAARTESITALQERQAELADLQEQLRDKQAALAVLADDEQANRRELVQQQAARKRSLEALARQISSQKQTIAGLERDDRRLGGLIDNINRLLAEQAARQARERRNARPPPAARSAPPAVAAAEPPLDTEFGQRRGRLRLPVQGEVLARFGSPRTAADGGAGPQWKGVFIRAATGTDVQAVAAGRVVFADWLRGFGNLLILDHGDGYLSVYGNNESLLKSLGDRVAAGDPVAEVGNTGGNSEPGLYFEIRFQGRPLDPLRWAQAR